MLVLDDSEFCAMCGAMWGIRVENYRDGLAHCGECITWTEDLQAAASRQTDRPEWPKWPSSSDGGLLSGRDPKRATSGWARPIASLITGVLGERGVRALTLRRLRSYAHHIDEFDQLESVGDNQLISVRGRAAVASRTVRGSLRDEPAVCSSVDIAMGDFAISHQSTVDFYLEDPHGRRILVQTDDARLSCPGIALTTMHSHSLREILAQFVPHAIEQLIEDNIHVRAGEYLLRPGDEVSVLGYKNRIVDYRLSERLARDEPYRVAVQSGPETPLLIASV